MKIRRLLLLGMFFSGFSLFAQKVKTVCSEFTYYAPETMNVVEAKRIALDRAKIKAIEEAFGSIVSQTNSTAISNINGESQSYFFSLGGSDVKGEWIETIDDPVYGDIYFQDNLLVVTCLVKGKVREVISSQIETIAKPLRNGTDLKYESYNFKEGDDLFLYFKSPTNGYLSVYLVDESSKIVYCALPYRNANGEPKQVVADREYILFSKAHADPTEKNFVDEYVISITDELEHNDFYILFSPEPFSKAVLENNGNPSLPKTIKLHEFQNWLARNRSKDPNITLSKIIITLSK